MATEAPHSGIDWTAVSHQLADAAQRIQQAGRDMQEAFARWLESDEGKRFRANIAAISARLPLEAAPSGKELSEDLKQAVVQQVKDWPKSVDSRRLLELLNGFAERIATLAIREERKRLEKYEKALDAIASWDEGDEVDSGFDEPCSAREAREILNEVRVAEYAQSRRDPKR